MYLPEHLEMLLDYAKKVVKSSIEKEGRFSLFAIALKPSGETVPVMANEGFTETGAAIGAVLEVLIPWAKAGDIIASVICTPIPPGVVKDGRSAVVFDLEDKDGWRIYAVLPYVEHDFLGLQFHPMEYSRGKAQLFAL